MAFVTAAECFQVTWRFAQRSAKSFAASASSGFTIAGPSVGAATLLKTHETELTRGTWSVAGFALPTGGALALAAFAVTGAVVGTLTDAVAVSSPFAQRAFWKKATLQCLIHVLMGHFSQVITCYAAPHL